MKKWARLVRLAEEEVQAVLRRMPEPLRLQAGAVETVFDHRPGREWIEDGVDADLLALFDGDALSVSREDRLWPPRIFLFLDNVWEEAQHDERAFREEVRISYLHEIGHYLGLEEDELVERDLE